MNPRWLLRLFGWLGVMNIIYKMLGRLMTEVSLQQRANFRKNRQLRGLRLEKRRLRYLNTLNNVHVEFIERLQRSHPELAAEIDAHQRDRMNALDGKRFSTSP